MAIHHTAPLPAKHLLGDITLSTQTLLKAAKGHTAIERNIINISLRLEEYLRAVVRRERRRQSLMAPEPPLSSFHKRKRNLITDHYRAEDLEPVIVPDQQTGKILGLLQTLHFAVFQALDRYHTHAVQKRVITAIPHNTDCRPSHHFPFTQS